MPTILVVDAHRDARYRLTHALTRAGFDVRETATGRDALRLCHALYPDAIVLDILLPDVDGFEIARRLKSDTFTKRICVVHIAPANEPERRAQALAAGADEYLTEPFEPEDLVAAIRRLLAQEGN